MHFIVHGWGIRGTPKIKTDDHSYSAEHYEKRQYPIWPDTF